MRFIALKRKTAITYSDGPFFQPANASFSIACIAVFMALYLIDLS